MTAPYFGSSTRRGRINRPGWRPIIINTEREISMTNIIVDELKPNLSADVPLDAFLRRASRIVEDEFGEKGEIPPSWFLVTASGQTHAVVMPFPATGEDPFADNVKNKGVAFMRDYFKKCDVVRYAHVAEAWMGTKPASVRASMDPNRIEIVSLIVEDRDGACCGRREIIRPASGKPYLGKLELADESPKLGYSRFGNLLYQPRPRSSDELPDDEGTVFVTNVPDAPFQIIGRRGPTGELFVGRIFTPRNGGATMSSEELPSAPLKAEVVDGEEGRKLISDVMNWLPKEAKH
jgi:hypothetical protein